MILNSDPAGSLIDELRSLPLADRELVIESLRLEEQQALMHTWSAWRRPSQVMPEGAWRIWLILAAMNRQNGASHSTLGPSLRRSQQTNQIACADRTMIWHGLMSLQRGAIQKRGTC